MNAHDCPNCGKPVRWTLTFCAPCNQRPNPAWEDFLKTRGSREQRKERLGICLDCTEQAMMGSRYCEHHREKRRLHCAERKRKMKVAVGMLALLLSGVAHASDLVEPRASDVIQTADVIASGRVASVTQYSRVESDGGVREFRTVQLAVKTCHKGDCGEGGVLVFEALGGPTMPVAVAPKIGPEDELLVFLQDRKLVWLQAGAVPVDLEGTPRAEQDTDEPTLQEELRQRYNLAPPSPSARMESPVQEANAGASPGPWRYFYAPPAKAQPPAFVVRQMNRANEFPGQEASRRSLMAALVEVASEAGITLTLDEAVGDYVGGYRVWPDQLSVVFDDPGNELTNPVNCSGILAVGGPLVNANNRLVGGTVYVADGWNGCSGLVNERERAMTLLHELGHALGLLHSFETTDGVVTQYQQVASMAPWLVTGRGAVMFPYDVDAMRFVYGPGNGAPSASPAPTGTPQPTPTFQPTHSPKPTRNPFACPLTGVVQPTCDCPSGKVWNKPRLCPRPSGKFSVSCKCVNASIGVLPSGCSRVEELTK